MNKFLFLILFLGISLAYIFDIDKAVTKIMNPFESIKKVYVETALSVQTNIDKYFSQAKQIEILQKENNELKKYKLFYKTTKNNLDSILKTIQTPNSTTEQIKFTKVLSYINFDDFTKVWIDFEKKDDSILGIISDEYAAGIVVNQDGRAKALLNGNEKANYSIFVGEKKAPGIIHSSKEGHYLVAKFIPIWFEIKEGDEVITSGMDNIFFEGLKVGKVIGIRKMQDIQEAIIQPYADVLKQKSFFVYKKIIEDKKALEKIKKEQK
ncbi:MAG: rod shape-determining protein MreC [Arcobacter sp.]|nr:MAG: rod shape-determining protein MreC [Arcobacter sp.]